MVRPSVHAFQLLVLLGLTGCGGTSGLPDDELQEGDVSALAEVLMFATFNSTSVLPSRPEPSTTGARWDMDFEAEVRCPGGGRVGLGASLVVFEAEDRAVYGLRQIHDDCAGTTPAGRFSISGGPRMVADVTVTRSAGTVAWSGRADGEVVWISEGRRGRCVFDLSFDGRRGVDGSASAEVVGSVCGHQADHLIPIQ